MYNRIYTHRRIILLHEFVRIPLSLTREDLRDVLRGCFNVPSLVAGQDPFSCELIHAQRDMAHHTPSMLHAARNQI